MGKDEKDQWLKSITEEIAREHNVLISPDDPTLVTAILNQKLMENFYKQQKDILIQFEANLSAQISRQNTNNQSLLKAITTKLVQQSDLKVQPPYPAPSTSNYQRVFIILLLFSLGTLIGYIFGVQ